MLCAIALASCAEGYPAAEQSALSKELTPAAGKAGTGGAPQLPLGGSGAAGMTTSGTAGTTDSAQVGDPCLRGEVETCPCEGVQTEGRRTCLFDPASPLEGFFTECTSCRPPPADPVEQCSDGEKNGFETDTDCGGPACDRCMTGESCSTTGDCEDAACEDGVCTMATPPAGGTSGAAGASGGEAGSGDDDSGSAGSSSDEPVSSCRGQDRGTPCDRDCILPGNTAQCNLFGVCSCL